MQNSQLKLLKTETSKANEDRKMYEILEKAHIDGQLRSSLFRCVVRRLKDSEGKYCKVLLCVVTN